MLACLLVIWTFSTRQMRTFFYNSFLGVHHLFILFICMMYYHPVRSVDIIILSLKYKHLISIICWLYNILSNIIQYQDNLMRSPPICVEYKQLDFNTTRTAHFMREHCKENPTFTAANKNVSRREKKRLKFKIDLILIERSFFFLTVLGLADTGFVDFSTWRHLPLLQTIFHTLKIGFHGTTHAQLHCFDISCKSASFIPSGGLFSATVWEYLDARVASIHHNWFRRRAETDHVYPRHRDEGWLDARAVWEDFQVFGSNWKTETQKSVEKEEKAENANDQEIEFHCRRTFS